MGDVDVAFWVRPFQTMEWSSEASIALIEEYKKQPALWDAKHQHNSSKSYKMEAWEEIASGMQLDVQEVKQKMNSLLGSFRRERSRMKKSRDGQGGGYSSKWFAFEKMQFLLRDDEFDTLGVKFEDEDDTIFEELRYVPHESTEPEHIEKRHCNVPSPSPKRQKKLSRPLSDPIVDDFTIFPMQDEYTAFGQYITNKLRKFDHRTRAFVENAINNVLFEAELGKYDNMASPFSPGQQNWDTSLSNTNQVAPNQVPAPPQLNNITNNS